MAGAVGLAVTFVFVVGLVWLMLRDDDPFRAQDVVNPPFPSLTYGIQAFLWWDDNTAGLHLDWVRLMSFSHVKQNFAWRDIEPTQGEWHFTASDRLLSQMEARGLKLIARLGQTPDWAFPDIENDEGMTDTPPASLDDWATYCRTVAERYGGRISAYQIWNEPNLSREWGNQVPDAEGYVELLQVCSEAIREVDSDVMLISAGIAPTGNNDAIAQPDDVYLDRMYEADFQQYIDVVGVHAPGFSPPNYGPDDAEADGIGRWFTFRRVEDLRQIMIQHGDSARQMAIMEFGWTTDTVNPDYAWYAIDEETQAQHLLEAYQYAIDHWRPWVGLMSLIYMPNPTWTEADEEYWWAISVPDTGHRPAYFALANMQKICGEFVIPARAPDSPEALGLVESPLCP